MATNYGFAGPRIVRDGLVLYLDAANPNSYNLSTPLTWRDISKNRNNGTLVNGTAVVSTTAGNVMSFDGVNDYVDCGQPAKLGNSLTGFTAATWVKPAINQGSLILENGTGFTSNTFYIAQENSNQFSFEVYGLTGYDAIIASNFNPYQTNVWYYLVGVWLSGQNVKLYINGTLDPAAPFGSSTIQNTLINGNSNLWVGRRPGGSFPFSGNIAMVKLYDRALSQSEITQNYNTTKGRFGL